jgi:flagellar M-ring protein FliF
MRTKATDTFKRLTQAFGAFSPGQKTVALVAVLAIVLGGFMFSSWVSKPSYSPLFSNLASADASAIVDSLKTAGTPYQLTDGGGTILVPQDQVYDLRLQMSGQGLPAQADTGYSLLDKQGVTTSEFQQQINYQRALSGELSKTVESIDGVTTAVVNLAMPEKSVFADDKTKPTAAVLVDLAPGKELSPQQVQAIVNLVSSGVTDLDADKVTVADSTGKVLSAPGQAGGVGGVADSRAQSTKAYEDRLSAGIQRMLDQVVGPGKSVAQVTTQLDFDKTQRKTETYTTKPGATPLNDSTTTEQYTGSGGNTSTGVLGPDNIQVPSGATNGTYRKQASARQNAVDKVTELRDAAPGAVVKQSVAVLVDAKTSAALPAGEIQRLVGAAAGIDATRGDTVVVSQMPFDGTAQQAAQKALADAAATEQRGQWMSMAKTAGLVLLVGVLLFLAWRSSRKTKRSDVTYAELERLDGEELAELEAYRNQELAMANRTALEARAEVDVHGQKRDEINAMVDKQPDEVAQLLRGWLADRRG